MALFNKTKEELLPEQFPEHIAFIMDGNGRWAKKRGLPRKFGHREGAKTFKKITRYCKDIGIKNITFYAFSTENWKRPEDEVSAIIELFREYIVDVRNYIGEEVRVLFLGDKTIFDDDLQKKMNDLEEDTKDYNKMTMLLAINYGGRDEIVHAAKILSEQVKRGEIQPDEITEDMFQKYLYTADVPDGTHRGNSSFPFGIATKNAPALPVLTGQGRERCTFVVPPCFALPLRARPCAGVKTSPAR